MADGSIGIWIGNDLDVALQLRWALRLAEARQLNLIVFEHVEGNGNESSALEVPLNEPLENGTSPLIAEVQQLIESSPLLSAGAPVNDEETPPENDTEQLITVRLKLIRSSTPREFREQMIEEARIDKLKVLTLARQV